MSPRFAWPAIRRWPRQGADSKDSFARQALKIKSDAEATKLLDDLTNSEIDVDLDDYVGDFWAAFSVCYSCDKTTYESVEALVGLLGDSLAAVKQSMPSKKNRGNSLGSALQTWGRGTAIVLKASEYLARAEATAQCLTPFIAIVNTFASSVSRCSPDILSCELSWATGAKDDLHNVYVKWKSLVSACIPEYSISEDDPRISTCITRWSNMVLDGWARVFKDILSAEPDKLDHKLLVVWIEATSTQRELLTSVTTGLASGPPSLLLPYLELTGACEHASKIAETLSLWRSLLTRTTEGLAPEIREYNALQGKTIANFKAFSVESVGARFAGSPERLLESKLLDPDATHMKAMIQAMVSAGSPKVQPVLDAFRAAFGVTDNGTKLTVWSTKGMPLPSLRTWLDATWDMKSVEEAVTFAKSVNDQLLNYQVLLLSTGVTLARALGEVDFMTKSRDQAQNFKELLLGEHHVTCWREADERFRAFKTQIESVSSMSKASPTQRFHLALLDDVVSYDVFMNLMEQEFTRVRAAFSDGISQTVATMAETLEIKMPQFFPSRVLDDKAACEQLMDADHGSLTSISVHMQEQLKHINSINAKFVAVGTPQLVQRAKRAAQMALTAVAFGAVLQCTERDWPRAGFTTAQECDVAVKSLKVQLAKTGWQPTPEVSQLLNDWQSGQKLKKLEEVEKQTPSIPTPSPTPKPEVQQLTKDKDKGEKRKRSESKPVADAQGEGGQSLAERLKAARSKKTKAA